MSLFSRKIKLHFSSAARSFNWRVHIADEYTNGQMLGLRNIMMDFDVAMFQRSWGFIERVLEILPSTVILFVAHHHKGPS